MKRRLFNIISAVSLLLCLGFAFLSVRSLLFDDETGSYRMTALDATNDDLEVYSLSSGRGGVTMTWRMYRHTAPTAEAMTEFRREKAQYIRDGRFHSGGWGSAPGPLRYGGSTSDPDHRVMGFGCEYVDSPRERGWGVLFPWAAPFAVTAICPAIAFCRRWRAARRRREGRCLTCGYDLRASKERCPECGTPMAATGAKA